MAYTNVVADRFLDVGKEPKEAIMPIEGYEQKPLVTLEEAVVRFEKTFDNLDSKVKTAIRNSQQPSDGLSSDESAAIRLYTMEWPEPQPSFYTLLNQHLRSAKRKALTPWFLYLKLFLTALYKLPSFSGLIWRGSREDVKDQYNDDCIWWGVSSCSETLSTTENFVGSVGKRTLFSIQCTTGKCIKNHSMIPVENEIILMPGTYLRVISKSSPAPDLYIIHLREATPPYQTIAPPFVLASPTTSIDKGNLKLRSSAAFLKLHGEIFVFIFSKSSFPSTLISNKKVYFYFHQFCLRKRLIKPYECQISISIKMM